jgi:hypothetical protein
MSGVMNTGGRRELAGIAGVIVGASQWSSPDIQIASGADALAIIHARRLMNCGSLLVTGILTWPASPRVHP